MGFELFVFIDDSPELASIKTSKEMSADEDGAVTPKADENRLKPVSVCPPAPMKRRPKKRKFAAALGPPPPPQGFFSVPKDLASVFLAVPIKKVRVG